jgi:DNA-binding response OmpR family regulator
MAEPIRTLIVDDDEAICFFLRQTLERVGHAVTAVTSGEEALEHLRNTAFDLAIMDLRLSGRVDGLRVLQAVKWRWPATATIILTGYGSLDTALTAIQEGVNVYLLKPVAADEMQQAAEQALERQKSVPQRQAASLQKPMLKCGLFTVDLEARQVTFDGRALQLTVREFDLLTYLIRHCHHVVPAEELVRAMRKYEPGNPREARDIVKWYVYRLRRKVEPDASRPRHIVNVRGVGYTIKE